MTASPWTDSPSMHCPSMDGWHRALLSMQPTSAGAGAEIPAEIGISGSMSVSRIVRVQKSAQQIEQLQYRCSGSRQQGQPGVSLGIRYVWRPTHRPELRTRGSRRARGVGGSAPAPHHTIPERPKYQECDRRQNPAGSRRTGLTLFIVDLR